MRKPDILEKQPVNMAAVRDELNRIEERDGELSFRGERTKEYLDEFSKLDADKATSLIDDLNDLDITRLKDEFIQKIVDILPSSMDELDVVLQGYTLSISSENRKKILDVLQDYV
jgi:DNA-directed RNA polymerase subunit F